MMTVMPRGVPVPMEDCDEILRLFIDCRKRGLSIMDAYTRIGQLMGRDPKVIGTIIARLRPTTDSARMYAKAKALKMIKRVVKKGSPAELIDVLSRPSIGVLDPIAKKGDGDGGGNFFISVQAQDCGAVKVGVAAVGEQPQLAEEAFDPFSETIDVGQELTHGTHGITESARRVEGTETPESLIAGVRRRLAEARGRGGASGPGVRAGRIGLQEADVHAQDAEVLDQV